MIAHNGSKRLELINIFYGNTVLTIEYHWSVSMLFPGAWARCGYAVALRCCAIFGNICSGVFVPMV